MKTLIFIRHAHRDVNQGRHIDSSLSELGNKQAKRIARLWKNIYGAPPQLIYSSPRARCIETVQPLSELFGVSTQILNHLDEGGDFQRKRESFIQHILNQPERIIAACSHGDWIPEFISEYCGTSLALSKGGMIAVEIFPPHRFQINWVLQHLGY